MPKTLVRIAAALMNSPWAIQEDWLKEMYAIFIDKQNHGNIEALLKARGIPQQDTDEDDYDRPYRGVYRRNATAVIPLLGPIFPRANMMTRLCGATSLSTTMQDFKAAQDDAAVERIVFPIDSPGGAVTLVDEMAALLAASNKPVYGHVQGTGASAAYWLLSQMTHASISPTSSVGSIGVIMSMTKYKKTADTEEYPKELQFVSSISPKKRLDPESKEGSAEIYAVVNSIAEVFAADVSKGRKVSLETVLEQFGQGGMLTGQAAVTAGMVDRVDTLEALLERLDKEESSSYSSYGEPQMKKNEYRDKFPEEYAAIRNEGAAVVQATLNTVTAQATALEQENANLKAENEKSNEINAANDARLKALEKDNAIKAEKANQVKAESIFEKTFAASGIPARLEDKVRKTCPTADAFTKDAVLDAEAYQTAISAEIADWAKALDAKAPVDPVIQGFGTGGAESDEVDEDNKADAVVDSMFAILGHAN